jgi:hypothetical protein
MQARETIPVVGFVVNGNVIQYVNNSSEMKDAQCRLVGGGTKGHAARHYWDHPNGYHEGNGGSRTSLGPPCLSKKWERNEVGEASQTLPPLKWRL